MGAFSSFPQFPLCASYNRRSVKNQSEKSGSAGILGKTALGVHPVLTGNDRNARVESKARFAVRDLLGCGSCRASGCNAVEQARREGEGRKGKRACQIGSSSAAQKRAYANPSSCCAGRLRFDAGQGSNGAHLPKLSQSRRQRHRHEPSRRDDGVADNGRLGRWKE